EDFQENNQGSAIHITSDGKFVYVSNRGHNSIAIFQVDGDTGMLSLVDFVSSEGDWPRDFILDPSENYLVGSNQESNNLVLYKRDKNSGKLTLLQKDVKVGHPVCVKFMK
ncbi:MAG: beta-propeller fold lactonase family protein, partial [Bacillus sp. (in: Bacteria)]|nr:beta-propeller fold lactonase family protein [Bacillus sp. (in: firmicutes)]